MKVKICDLVIQGHCYSKKNHRPIHADFRRAAAVGIEAGRLVTKPKKRFVGKSKELRQYEEHAVMQARCQWDGPPLEGPVRIRMVVYFAGPKPDAFGPAETIFDVLEAAGVVANDRQLIPWGTPAIERRRVTPGEQRVWIRLEPGEAGE